MKSTKEKILFPTMIILMILEFVIMWLFASAIENKTGLDSTYAGIAVVIWLLTMTAYFMWVAERDKRRIEETLDTIMDAIMEFYKENRKTTMTVEKGLGKTKNINK